MAEIVYTAVTDATSFQGGLFEGAKFWLSQKVPQRKRFIEEVKVSDRQSMHETAEYLADYSRPTVVKSRSWRKKQMSRSWTMLEKRNCRARTSIGSVELTSAKTAE